MAAVSLAGDLGMGFPLEHAVRVTYVAGRVARTLGLGAEERWNAFHVSLLHGIGCTADSHDLARVFGADEIALKHAGALLDEDDRVAGLRMVVGRAGTAGPAILRPVALARSLARGDDAFREGLRAHCEVGELLAERVGVPSPARAGLLALFERWDGKGVGRIAGSRLPLAARVFHVAKVAVAHLDVGGPDAAVAAVRGQAGGALEPRIAEALLDEAAEGDVLAIAGEPDLVDRTLELEPPELRIGLDGEAENALFEAIADMADLKSPAFVGHSRGVAALAVDAARRLGLGGAALPTLHRAALAHDLGRVAVPNTILDKRGRLTPAEWESIRLHPYHTERILLRSAVLAPAAVVAGCHHERLDGSGYHRGVRGADQAPPARVLAAADACQALRSVRPYRPAFSPARAAAILRADVRDGRLDGDAVEAVIAGAEGRPHHRVGVAGRLSARETEVLRLLAAGLTTGDVAGRLAITEKTVRHHVEHVFDKLGVSTRAGAVVAAMGQGLLADPPAEPGGG